MNPRDRLIKIAYENPGLRGSLLPIILKTGGEYLWHGSRDRIPVLEPRQAVDTGGAAGSNKNAIYATDYKPFAIMMGLAAAGSDTGLFWEPGTTPQMILFSGSIRHGEKVYLHKLPRKDGSGQDQFVPGGADHEFYSRPGLGSIAPVDIEEVPVDSYLHLIRTPTPEDLARRQHYLDLAQRTPVSKSASMGYMKPHPGLKSAPGYYYHATNLERAHSIAREGMHTHLPHEYTDQDIWPDGGEEPRSYYSANAGIIYSFAPEEGQPVVLRVPVDAAHFGREPYTKDIYTTEVIPGDRFEILREDGTWVPLKGILD